MIIKNETMDILRPSPPVGETPLISVLLPAYGVEAYLARCIETVLNQTYKNLEIIIVDDCSPDSSGAIAEQYAKKDARIKVFHHAVNQGLSGARNTGLKNATGEYVTFVDSDDYIEPDYIGYLFGIVKQTGCDIAMSKHFFTTQFRKQAETDKITTITPEDMLCDIFYNRIHEGVWNRLYRKTLLDGKWFRLESKTGEGMQFNTRVVPYAERIGVGLRRVYTYNVDNETSATKKPNIEKQAMGSVETMDFIKVNLKPRSERLDNAVEYQYFTTALYALSHLVMADDQKKHRIFYRCCVNYCRKTAPKTLKMEINKKQILKSLLVWVSPYLAIQASITWRRRLGVKQRI